MSSRRLTGLDTVFLAAETAENPLHMMAIMILDPSTVPGGYSFDRLRGFLAQRLPLVPPMRRRLVEVPLGLARPVWVEEETIDLGRHLRRAALPAPGGASELAALAGELDERPLDRRRPLWELVVVEGVEGGRIAVLAKLHHSMMDGMAGMQFMAALFSDSARYEERAIRAPLSRRPAPSRLELLKGALTEIAGKPAAIVRAGAETLQRRIDEIGQDEPPVDTIRVPRMCLNGRVTADRSVATVSISLGALSAVASACSATVNDVLLTVIGGALRSELVAYGWLPREPLVAAVPISTRDPGDDDVANAVAGLFVSLATDKEDPCARLEAIRRDSRRAKARQRAGVGASLAAWLDVPAPLTMSLAARAYSGLGLVDLLSPLCNVVISNVPGPPQPLYFAGAKLVGLYPLGPVFDGVQLNITALGREGNLDVGLVASDYPMGELGKLASAIPTALDELVASLVADAQAERSA